MHSLYFGPITSNNTFLTIIKNPLNWLINEGKGRKLIWTKILDGGLILHLYFVQQNEETEK